jgi:predicted nucleic acid-binding protein
MLSSIRRPVVPCDDLQALLPHAPRLHVQDCVSCALSSTIEEIRRVTRRQGIRFRIHQAEAGRLVNDRRRLATLIENLPTLDVSPDPYDNFLLAMAQAGQADLLVTGDKRDRFSLSRHRGMQHLDGA